MPAELPACVVALQHTEPGRGSALSSLLDRAGPLPVADARDGAALVPGTVVVAPSGFHS